MKSTVYFDLLFVFVWTFFSQRTVARIEDSSLYIDAPQILAELQKSGLSPLIFLQNPSAPPPLSQQTSPQASQSASPQSSQSASPQTSLNAAKTFFEHPMMQEATSAIRKKIEGRLQSSKGSSYSINSAHRLLNPDWLVSPDSNLELVGIVHRFDRKDFYTSGCGEVRAIFRLSYSIIAQRVYSRLPLTMMMVFKQNQNCKSALANWLQVPALISQNNSKSLLENLKLAMNASTLHSVEFNLQSERWPSTVKPDTSGYAEYDLWVFKFNEDRTKLTPSTLENTPDVKLLADRSKRDELLKFIKTSDNLSKLDRGTLVLPEKFLARTATSFAFHGVARLSNKPFNQLYSTQDFSDIDLTKFKRIQTSELILMRLNDLTCTGCHHSRTIAGFHFLGTDLPQTSPYNSIFKGFSSHFKSEIEYRRSQFEGVMNNSVVLIRDFALRGTKDPSKLYSTCSLDQTMPADWKCLPQHTCERFNLDALSRWGRCEPSRPKFSARSAAVNPLIDSSVSLEGLSSPTGATPDILPTTPMSIQGDAAFIETADQRQTPNPNVTLQPLLRPDAGIENISQTAGFACRVGQFKTQVDPQKDTIEKMVDLNCGTRSVCEKPLQGFPGGMCTRDCKVIGAQEVCGPVALLGPFNACLAARQPFDQCLKSSIRMSALQACDQSNSCRSDFVCTTVQGQQKGACIPPYFLLQLRVDGHPDPIRRSPSSEPKTEALKKKRTKKKGRLKSPQPTE